ncbi:aldehyde dehydrogenase family protein [Afifella marina]|uniref:Aldehyde dehydrogenase (NAD+) n=2 Tax=Hyphomicrobiales TaxID=356 RepID=A0A1G5NUD0_AFIMA|nr:aldehyde dehydrogenase family protein [Afifella marina]MBK1624113.1 aldehyde dehydrogenase [Afifella marina DSM 2698]MBK1627670.1 aldehyde dehydrogenase [Afifella marina]MBK5916394.1 aldehyde dehydrogenase [Afifella marina]RAI20951.1 aldehyde dehydrogenase [Afifella marina DSM 2698]SCZ40844.1 aldehyde dehydrogenase (NAD+) [Afifella marina DSM 2698]
MSLSFDPASVVLPVGHHIGGRLMPADGQMAVNRASDGVAVAGCPIADASLVDVAVAAAKEALKQSGWAKARPRERVKALHAWADLIVEEGEALGRLESIVSTRPIAQSISGDVATTAEQIRFFAEFADKEGGVVAPTSADRFGMVDSEPYGVVGAIVPWNFPISMAGWKLGPALAAGNAVVLKPSEMTPFSALMLAELAVRAGIPEGLINVVLGDGGTTGNAITGHPDIAKVSFTGSSRAGAAIMANIAATGIKPMTLELGGKSPQIVFADADLDLAADCVARGILSNAGQVCVAGSRLLVEASVAEPFVEKVRKHFDAIRPGPTWDEGTSFSPIISDRQICRIETIVEEARKDGAEVVVGAKRTGPGECFYHPTILAGVDQTSPAVVEEIFGPVLTVQTFTDEDEAAALADHPTYGLCSGIYTKDLSRAVRLSRSVQAGTVWINRYGRSQDHILPTGGYKGSGLGKDLGREAYLANRRTKSVLIDL